MECIALRFCTDRFQEDFAVGDETGFKQQFFHFRERYAFAFNFDDAVSPAEE